MSNRFTVVGSIGADPERRTTKSGEPFITFSVASNERRQNAEGTWVDGRTSWFDVSAYGALGRNAVDALHRGDRVVVLGDLTISQYETAGGGKGRSADIRATAIGHDLTLGGPRASRQQSTPGQQSTGQQSTGQQSTGQPGTGQGRDSRSGAERPVTPVDHSSEWAPIALDDRGASSENGSAAEPEWMTTPF